MAELVIDTVSSHLDTVRQSARERLSSDEAEAYLAALTTIMEQAAPDEASGESPEALFGATHGLWSFGALRRPGEARLRLYQPEGAAQGWTSERTIIEVVNDDMPFLVDSLTALIADQGHQIQSVLHPILHIRRGAAGERLGLAAPGEEGALRESWIQIQLDCIGDLKSRAALETAIAAVLADVRVAVADWKPMLTRLREAAAALRAVAPAPQAEAASEAAEFLEWLAANHFTFLGCRDYALSRGADGATTATPSGGLGLMRDPSYTTLRDAQGRYADWTPEMDAFAGDAGPLLILKANRRSTVHRTTHLDFIGVKRYDAEGRVIGVHGFIGLFTSAAYNRSPINIPMLRGKVRRIIESAGLAQDSHDGKALAHMLETHPRDELLQATEEQLREQAIGALHLSTRPRTRLFVRRDRFGRFFSCIVYAPRERYDTALRMKIGEILCNAFDGRVADFTPAFGGDNLIRVHFVIAVRIGAEPEYELETIEARIVEAVRDWSDGLREALVERFGAARGAGLHARYRSAFSAGYRETVRPADAAADIQKLEAIGAESPIACAFYRLADDPEHRLRFKLYRLAEAAPLSDVMPILENMGLRVLEEHPHQAQRRRGGETAAGSSVDVIHIHDFMGEATNGAAIELEARRAVLESG
ncbi:MAG: NAD-glutamate dehydrogenase, partial [Pseudomonadota bacterium]